MDAYEQIYPNLIKHNPDYPTADHLRSISFVGDEVFDRVKDLRDKRWELVPGGTIMMKPDDWADTPGSDKIVEVLLEDNPDPVFIQAWGGGNTAARAFYKLKTQYPNDYKRAVSKVTMYNKKHCGSSSCVQHLSSRQHPFRWTVTHSEIRNVSYCQALGFM